jgi:hypothetical protein
MTNQNEMNKNMWGEVKTVFEGKLIALNAYIRKEGICNLIS